MQTYPGHVLQTHPGHVLETHQVHVLQPHLGHVLLTHLVLLVFGTCNPIFLFHFSIFICCLVAKGKRPSSSSDYSCVFLGSRSSSHMSILLCPCFHTGYMNLDTHTQFIFNEIQRKGFLCDVTSKGLFPNKNVLLKNFIGNTKKLEFIIHVVLCLRHTSYK